MTSLWRSRWLIGSAVLTGVVIGLLKFSYQQGVLVARAEGARPNDSLSMAQALSQCEANWLKADKQAKNAQQQIAFEKEKAQHLYDQLLKTQKVHEALKDELALLKTIYNSKVGVKEQLIVHPLKMLHVSGTTYNYHFILSKPSEKTSFKGRLKIQWVGASPVWKNADEMKSFLKKTQREQVLEFKQFYEAKGQIQLPSGFTPEEVIILIASTQSGEAPLEHHFSWKSLTN